MQPPVYISNAIGFFTSSLCSTSSFAKYPQIADSILQIYSRLWNMSPSSYAWPQCFPRDSFRQLLTLDFVCSSGGNALMKDWCRNSVSLLVACCFGSWSLSYGSYFIFLIYILCTCMISFGYWQWKHPIKNNHFNKPICFDAWQADKEEVHN